MPIQNQKEIFQAEPKPSQTLDEILADMMPIISLLASENGTVFKANKLAAAYFKSNQNNLQGLDIISLFNGEARKMVANFFSSQSGPNSEITTFKTQTEAVNNDKVTVRAYSWQIRICQTFQQDKKTVLVVGRDTTEANINPANLHCKNKKTPSQLERNKCASTAKSKQIDSIADNTFAGILTLKNSELDIQEEYSSNMEYLLGIASIAEGSFENIFLNHTTLGADEKEVIVSILSASFDSPIWCFESNRYLLPREVIYQHASIKKFFEIDWIPIYNKSKNTTKIVISLRDLTADKNFKLHTKNDTIELTILDEIINAIPEQNKTFLNDASHLIKKIKGLVFSQSFRKSDLKQVFIILHTLKGTSRTLGFKSFSNIIHEAETNCLHYSKHHDLDLEEFIIKTVINVENIYQRYTNLNQQILGRTYNSDFEQKNHNTIRELLNFLSTHRCHKMSITEKKIQKDSTDFLLQRYFKTLPSIIETLSSGIDSLAKKLQKPTPTICIEGDKFYFLNESEMILRSILVHLITNSLDHGIETRSERYEKGKKDTGRINIDLEETTKGILIQYRDDGAGINIGLLKSKENKDASINQKTLEKGNILDLILKKSLSTKNIPTNISGRGIGMNAVREFVENQGGFIKVLPTGNPEAKKFQSFYFEILLPKKFFFKIEK